MLSKGYSKPTIVKNIRREYAAGRSVEQSVAIALRSARRDFKKAHPRRALPSYLRGSKP